MSPYNKVMKKFLSSNFIGIVPIYKPIGPTSHTIVNRVRRLTGIKKVGHAGTLDPLAEGVLVVAITRQYTKQLSSIVKKEKEYVTHIKLGETSTTDDSEGEKKVIERQKSPSLNIIQTSIPSFKGKIWQTPPVYSAVKVNGKSAYKYIRRGENVTLEPRQREVKDIELLKYSWPSLELRIVTGSGVYIRAIARDLGDKLGVGGYMASLTRTRVGDFSLDDCYHLPDEN
jgi:tRNA pseudouridine55 synthase